MAPVFPSRALRLTALITFGCGLAGYAARTYSHGAVAGLPVAALLVLAVEAALDRKAEAPWGPEGKLVVRLAMLGAAGLWAAGAYVALATPIAQRTHQHIPWPWVHLFYLLPVLAVSSPIAGLVGAAASSRLVRSARVLRAAALGAIGLAVALVAASALRAARLPEPRRYLASLPLVDGFAVNDVDGFGTGSQHVDLTGVRFAWTCFRWRCNGAVGPIGAEVATPYSDFTFQANRPVEIRRDAATDRWIVDAAPGIESATAGRRAYGPDLRPVTLAPKQVAARLSPPRGWIAGGLAGILVAVAMLARNRRARRMLGLLRAATEGVLGADGWVTFADASPPLRVTAPLAVGPVVVVRAVGQGSAYRGGDERAPHTVLGGTLDHVVAAVRADVAARDAFALAAVAVTAAPLVVAAALGFVG